MNTVGVLNMHIKQIILVGLAALVLSSCEGDKSTTLQDSLTLETTSDVVSTLNFGENIIPFPNNLLFQGTADGTLNIPVADPADLSDPQVALNGLDGFSTVSPITAGFSGELDEASFPLGIKLYEATFSSGVIVAVNAALTYGVDYVGSQSVGSSGASTLVIFPLKPLKPKQAYFVVLTNALKSASGRPAGISGSYTLTHRTTALVDGSGTSTTPLLSDAQAQQLEPLRQATVFGETSLNTFDATESADIILSWNFTTQSISDVLAQVRTDVRNLTANAVFSPTSVGDTPLGAASIHVGTLDVPYFLTASASVNDPTALTSYWKGAAGSNLTQFNTAAVVTSTQTIPMMVTIPKTGSGPWPVVIYQHGITRKRADVLAVADSLSLAGFAVVAIDLPMHGITGNETDGSAPFKDTVNGERTFDLDLVDSTGAPGPDTVTDPSGTHFINLSNLLNSRDNIRQAASDLFALVDAINEGKVTDGVNVLDKTRIHFLGHSLGAIVGTPFLALETDVKASALINSGSGIAKILDGSTSFGPVIAAGLAAKGVNKGTADYESFLGAAQTVIDSGDPVNYSLNAAAYAPSAAANRGLYFSEIVGPPSDLTVPITVPDANDTSGTVPAPLAGAEPQIKLLGLTTYNSDQTGTNLQAVTKFTSGYHGSLIDPSSDVLSSAAVTSEMQKQIATFLATNGAFLDVTDSNLLLAP